MKKIHMYSRLPALFVAVICTVCALQATVTSQDNEWYTGGSIGLTNYKISGFDDVNIPDRFVDFQETEFAYRALVGRRINRNFSVELALSDYGEASGPLSEGRSDRGDAFKIHERGATVYATGFLPLGNHYLPELKQVELFGQVGPAWIHQEVELDGTDPSGNPVRASREDNGFGVGAGVGVNLYVTNHLAIRGELESIFGDATDLDERMGTDRIHGFVGIQYNFHDLPVSDSRR